MARRGPSLTRWTVPSSPTTVMSPFASMLEARHGHHAMNARRSVSTATPPSAMAFFLCDASEH
eukprot:7381426-Prymnesium_polylepis.1